MRPAPRTVLGEVQWICPARRRVHGLKMDASRMEWHRGREAPLFKQREGHVNSTRTIRTRCGWMHSIPVITGQQDYDGLVMATDSMSQAADAFNVLVACGFVPHLGRSERVEVAAALCEGWTVYVEGDRDRVRAAAMALSTWRNGGEL